MKVHFHLMAFVLFLDIFLANVSGCSVNTDIKKYHGVIRYASNFINENCEWNIDRAYWRQYGQMIILEDINAVHNFRTCQAVLSINETRPMCQIGFRNCWIYIQPNSYCTVQFLIQKASSFQTCKNPAIISSQQRTINVRFESNRIYHVNSSFTLQYRYHRCPSPSTTTTTTNAPTSSPMTTAIPTTVSRTTQPLTSSRRIISREETMFSTFTKNTANALNRDEGTKAYSRNFSVERIIFIAIIAILGLICLLLVLIVLKMKREKSSRSNSPTTRGIGGVTMNETRNRGDSLSGNIMSGQDANQSERELVTNALYGQTLNIEAENTYEAEPNDPTPNPGNIYAVVRK